MTDFPEDPAGPPDPVVPEQVARVEDDPKKPYKAIASTVLSFLAAAIAFWIADEDPFTSKDVGEAILTGLVAAGLVGGTTFGVSNPKRVRNES